MLVLTGSGAGAALALWLATWFARKGCFVQAFVSMFATGVFCTCFFLAVHARTVDSHKQDHRPSPRPQIEQQKEEVSGISRA